MGILIYLNVEDMLILNIDLNAINSTKIILSSRFELKDLLKADVILRIKTSKIDEMNSIILISLY